MEFNLENILLIIAAVVVLFAGVHILRFLMRYLWRLLRIVLIAGVLLLILGHVLGWINIPLL